MRTPLIAHWPGVVEEGGATRSLVSSVDIAPTLLELAGVAAPDTLQGKSFAGILRDPAAETRDYVFAEHNWHDYQAHERAIRSHDYLYIRNAFPHLPGTPPADAVRSPTFLAMRALRDLGTLPVAQSGCFLAPRPAEELYRVSVDPHCLVNLAGDPNHAEALARLSAELDDWIERTGDRIPPEPTPDGFDRETGERRTKGPRP